ncbi:MAG: type II toxin-antitoxin system VapB family antitoxin [Nitrospirae bacterium]|nr:type II toxin-antitoxin system VapB family antitoxin [Nitrospirota bacterium]
MTTRTNIMLDDDMVDEAKKLTSFRTKREVVDFALRELVKQLKKKKLLAIRHKGMWQGDLAKWRSKRIDIN